MRSIFFTILAFLLLAPVASAAGGTPLEALKTAQAAVDASDVDLFRSVVDMDALLTGGFEEARQELLSLSAKGELKGADPLLVASLSDREGLAAQMAAQLFLQDVKDYVAIGIRNGYFSGQAFPPESAAGPFPGIMKRASPAKKEIRPGKVLSQKGNRATVSAVLVDYEAGSFPVELGLGKTDQGWRIDSVANARALTREIVKKRK